MSPPSIIERAYQLARSGECASVEDIRKRLRTERFSQVDQELQGLALRRELKALCQAARSAAQP